jgi:hypothetical protein
MDNKYKILSLDTLINMSVAFQAEGSEKIENISVSVDYANQKIYFQNESLDINYSELEKQILSALALPFYETPAIPSELLDMVSEVKSGKYQNDISNYGSANE